MFRLGDFDIKTTRIYEEVSEEEKGQGVGSNQFVLGIQLSIEQLENLAEALLNFSTEGDLVI